MSLLSSTTTELLSYFDTDIIININNKNNNALQHTVLFLDELLNKKKQFTRKDLRNFVP